MVFVSSNRADMPSWATLSRKASVMSHLSLCSFRWTTSFDASLPCLS